MQTKQTITTKKQQQKLNSKLQNGGVTESPKSWGGQQPLQTIHSSAQSRAT